MENVKCCIKWLRNIIDKYYMGGLTVEHACYRLKGLNDSIHSNYQFKILKEASWRFTKVFYFLYDPTSEVGRDYIVSVEYCPFCGDKLD